MAWMKIYDYWIGVLFKIYGWIELYDDCTHVWDEMFWSENCYILGMLLCLFIVVGLNTKTYLGKDKSTFH